MDSEDFDIEPEELCRLIREDIEWEYRQMLEERKREAYGYGILR
jgi:hypothetical protein